MKNFILLLAFLLATSVAFGQIKKPVDTYQIGKQSSAADKAFIFNTNDGVANPKLSVEVISKMMFYDKNIFRVGDGAAGFKEYRFDTTGGTDASLKADFLTGDLFYNFNNFSLGDGTDTNIRHIFNIGAGGANPYIGYNSSTGSLVQNDGTGEKPFGSGSGGGSEKNLLPNPSFENAGAPILNWTNTGGTLTQETFTNGTLNDSKYLKFVASAAGQSFQSDLVVIPDDFDFGMMVHIRYLTASTTDDLWDMAILDEFGATVASSTLAAFLDYKKSPIITLPSLQPGSSVQFLITSNGPDTIQANAGYMGENQNTIAIDTLAEKLELSVGDGFGSADTQIRKFANLVVDSSSRLFTHNHGSYGTAGLEVVAQKNIRVEGAYCDTGVAGSGSHGISIDSSELTTTWHSITEADRKMGVWTAAVSGIDGGCASFDLDLQTGQTLRTHVGTLPSNPGTHGKFWLRATSLDNQILAYSPDQAEWLLDVSIGGAVISTSATGGTPEELIDAGLDMVVNPGSVSVTIPCSTTNVSTGLTCSSGSESTGAVFVAKRPMRIILCASLPYNGAGANGFRWVETADGSQTEIRTGKDIGYANGDSTTVNICDFFDIATPGKKVFRIFQDGGGGDTIKADRTSTTYEQEVHITGRMVDFLSARPVIQNMVTTTRKRGVRIVSCSIKNNGSASKSGDTSLCDWMGPPVRQSAGNVDIVPNPGVFSGRPNCSVNLLAADVKFANSSSTASLIQARTVNTSNTGQDFDFDIFCEGAK